MSHDTNGDLLSDHGGVDAPTDKMEKAAKWLDAHAHTLNITSIDLKEPSEMNFLKRTKVWKTLRHRISLIISQRENSTFTGFLRLPTQFDALSGPVVEFLLNHKSAQPLVISVMGCSNGAEAYTISSILSDRRPKLEYEVHAYDINPDCISKARRATFAHEEIFNNKIITRHFIDSTFDRQNDLFVVKPEIRRRIRFEMANILDDDLHRRIPHCDIVFAQNFLFHMPPRTSAQAFGNIIRFLNTKAVLFIDGMDLGLRQKLTRKNQLAPLEYKIEEIHNEARRAREIGWPYQYWGLEPFLTTRRDGQRRYSTIFLKTGG